MLMVRVDQVRVASSDPALLAVTVKPRMSLAGTLPVNTCELRVSAAALLFELLPPPLAPAATATPAPARRTPPMIRPLCEPPFFAGGADGADGAEAVGDGAEVRLTSSRAASNRSMSLGGFLLVMIMSALLW